MHPFPNAMLGRANPLIEWLAVGAGGAGSGAEGSNNGHGGLGGQVLTGTALSRVGLALTITIGAGNPSDNPGTATQLGSLATANGGAAAGQPGPGVNGPASSISGSSVVYGSSGGGAGSSPGSGAGLGSLVGDGDAGVANRGGGGGGSSVGDGGAGGTGVAILRYLTGSMLATGGTITTVGLYTIHTFNSSGTFTVTA